MKACGRWSEVQAKLDLDQKVADEFKEYVDGRTYRGGYNDMYIFMTLIDYLVKDEKIAYAFADTTTGLEALYKDEVILGVYDMKEKKFHKEGKIMLGTIHETKLESLLETEKAYEIKFRHQKDIHRISVEK